MFSERTYAFGDSTLTLKFGDLVDSTAEVLVSSDDGNLSMGGGVSRAIARRGGDALLLDARKASPRQLGDVVVTTAGALDARYVFHVITIRPNYDFSDVDVDTVVRTATARCLDLVDALEVSSIAFPALGTGKAGFPIESAAEAMADVIAVRLERGPRPLRVELRFLIRFGEDQQLAFISFFEEFARRRPKIAGHEVRAPADQVPASPRVDESVRQLLALERERQRLEREIVELSADIDPGLAKVLKGRLVDNQSKRIEVKRQDQDRARPVKLFVSYAREDSEYRDGLAKHLSSKEDMGLVRVWYDCAIEPGDAWDDDIHKEIDDAEVIVFLVSSDFMSSHYIRENELKRAFERLDNEEVALLPVLVRSVDLKGERLSALQLLPKDSLPIARWEHADDAYVDVVEGILRVADRIRRARTGQARSGGAWATS